MAEINHTIGSAIKGLCAEDYEFYKAIVDRAFEKDPAMKERYRQVELDYDAAMNTAQRRSAADFVYGELPNGVFMLASATEQIVKASTLPLWLNRARYLAHRNRLMVSWFFIEGKWVRCVTLGALKAAFDKYYPRGTV